MTYQCFDVDITEHIAHIRFRRPEQFNSMILEFWSELLEIINYIDNDSAARVVVLSSTGKHFTAGMDLSVFDSDSPLFANTDVPNRGVVIYESIRRFQRTISCLETCRVPVIAAIQGGCVGGGVDLVTACDMRYATSSAFFCIQEINLGMTADVGTFPRLANLIPEGIAREFAYTGDRMTASRAREIGLVNELYGSQDEMVDHVMATARSIAEKAPMAIYGTKQMINYGRDHSTEDTLDYLGVWNAGMLQTQEVKEALSASKSRRPGDFADLPPRQKSK